MMSKLSFLSSKISPSKEISGIQYASFDFVSFAIRNLFFDKFSVSDAQEFQSFLLNSSIPDVIQQGHDVIRSSLFIEIFDIFLSELRAIYGDFAHQALPTFRLQMPGHRSVPFHTDDLSSGHPFDLINVWLPLTKTNFYNSLHFVPAEISASLKDEFVESAKTIEWLDSSSRSNSLPWLSDYGDIVFFSNSTLHGTYMNNSDVPRASIDFRIICDKSSRNLNRKKLGIDFVLSDNLSVSSGSCFIPAVSIVYCANDASHIPHPVQRSLINNFAQQNSFEIIRETAEWQVDHCPVILDVLDNQPDVPILLSTKAAFSLSGAFVPGFKRLLPKLRAHPAGAYFCFENKKIE